MTEAEKAALGETINVAAWCRGCGGLVFVSADEPDRRKENAREIVKAVRQGYRVGEIATKDVWALPGMGCKCPKPDARKAKR